jgi:hypothetical protein
MQGVGAFVGLFLVSTFFGAQFEGLFPTILVLFLLGRFVPAGTGLISC